MNSNQDVGKGAIVITGASTGIGRATALRLDKEGFHVFAGVRKQSDGDSLKSASSEVVPVLIDVIDPVSIAGAFRVVKESVGVKGLAGLVNNSGISLAYPVEFFPLDQILMQLNVNLVGHIAVMQAFLPLIRKGKGRIVNIGSIGGIRPIPSLGIYDASKAGMHALTDALRMELSIWEIPVILVVPGNIATPIWTKPSLATNLSGMAQEYYAPLMDRITRTVEKMAGKGLPPEAAADIVFKALTVKKPKARYVVGRDALLQVIMTKLLGGKAQDALVWQSLGKKPKAK